MAQIAADKKAFLETEKGVKIPCMFNPAELSIVRTNTWEAKPIPGVSAPTQTYKGGSPGSMSLNLTFDTTGEGVPVTNYTNKMMDLMKIDTTLEGYDATANNGRPCWVTFNWGTMQTFRMIIKSMTVSFTYFSSSGTPLRATVATSMEQYEPDPNWGPQNPTSGTPKPHRVHRVQKGETLDRISARHYGDSTKWRLIAEANGIHDPLALRPGAFLNIPKKEG